MSLEQRDLSNEIIRTFYHVYNELGYGFLELKAAECLSYENECQLINYLRATEIEIGLLLNFGRKPEFKRKFFTNDRKKGLSNPRKSV